MGSEQAIKLDTNNQNPPEDLEPKEKATSSNLFFNITDYFNQVLAVIAGLALISILCYWLYLTQ